MAAHLTDTQKKKIIRDYVELGSYNAVAKKHGVARNTVKNTVLADPKYAKKCQEKRSQNARAILAHMDTKREKVCQIVDLYLDEMLDVEQFDRLTPAQLAKTLEILIDKFTATEKATAESNIEPVQIIDDL